MNKTYTMNAQMNCKSPPRNFQFGSTDNQGSFYFKNMDKKHFTLPKFKLTKPQKQMIESLLNPIKVRRLQSNVKVSFEPERKIKKNAKLQAAATGISMEHIGYLASESVGVKDQPVENVDSKIQLSQFMKNINMDTNHHTQEN